MKQGYTHICVVLDKSGSMGVVEDDTRGGFNAFLKEQKKQTGETTFTLIQFAEGYQVIENTKPIHLVEPLTEETYVADGASTSLLDAIGRGIIETGKVLAELSEEARPENVIFVILTDGQENSSREFGSDQINKMIEEQKSKYNWKFVFLGANQDAIATAESYGIGSGSALTYASNSAGVKAVFTSTANYVNSTRSMGEAAFTVDDRKAQEEAGV